MGETRYDERMDEYRRKRENRRVYTLGEIAAFPATQNSTGYVNRRIEPGVWVGEHILVAESMLGVVLPKGSNVHHRDGNRANNEPENLEVWLSSHPYGQRASCPRCGWPDLETL